MLFEDACWPMTLDSMQHIGEQYQLVKPALQALAAAYPEHILLEHVSEKMYIWACELWYSYAMEVSPLLFCPNKSATRAAVRLLNQMFAMADTLLYLHLCFLFSAD